MIRWMPGLLLVLVLVGSSAVAQGVTFTEDFESFDEGEADPDQSWYNFNQGDENGTVNGTDLVIEGNQSFLFNAGNTDDLSTRIGSFNLEVPVQLDEVTFTVQADPPANSTGGSQQWIRMESDAPRRSVVEFYIFCADSSSSNSCTLKVRFDHVDSTGQVLINKTLNETRFEIQMVFDWVNAEYQLFVNGVDDGTFPFLELPQNIQRIQFRQYRGDVPWRMSFDNWTVVGARNGTTSAVEGDVADGIKGFAQDIRFTSSGSKIFLGVLIFAVVNAAVAVPLVALGRDSSVLPAMGFFSVLSGLWLINMEFWPEWIGIALIVVAAALIGQLIRRTALGMRDASGGAGLVAGSLGYFIIASSLLAFSGYATDTVTLPTSPAEQQDDVGGNTTGTQQTFVGAVTECIFSGGVFTFGLVGDCSQETQTTTWKKITDAAGQIYGWIQASLDYVFQLLTFTLPIPTFFNIILIGPPAAALAAYGFEVIRG